MTVTPVVPLLTLGKRRGFLLSKRYKTRRYLAVGGLRYAVPFGLTKGANMPMTSIEQQAKNVHYCDKCDWVIRQDVHILQVLHIKNCVAYNSGYDCMHMEGKICCECDAA